MHRLIKISQICSELKLHFEGDDIEISGLNLCNRNSKHNKILTYVTNEDYVETIQNNMAVVGIVLATECLDAYRRLKENRKITFVISDNPEDVFYNIHDYLYYHTDFYEKYSFPSEIGEDCDIHPSAIIEEGVIIGKNVTIGANTVVRRGTVIKDNCIIGCNTTIGSEGFQIIRAQGRNRKIVHCGGVAIQDNVFIGDNVTVCNSMFEDTACIGSNAMIDNLVHVGHNVQIGEGAVITAGTILCGSAAVERGAWIGVNSSVLNRVTVGENAKVGIGSVVTRNIPRDTLAYGVPAKVKNC